MPNLYPTQCERDLCAHKSTGGHVKRPPPIEEHLIIHKAFRTIVWRYNPRQDCQLKGLKLREHTHTQPNKRGNCAHDNTHFFNQRIMFSLESISSLAYIGFWAIYDLRDAVLIGHHTTSKPTSLLSPRLHHYQHMIIQFIILGIAQYSPNQNVTVHFGRCTAREL